MNARGNRAGTSAPKGRWNPLRGITFGIQPRNTTRLLLVAGLLLGSLTVLGSNSASAAGESLTVLVTQQDGAAPFDADSVAGHDANDANGIVRTNDNLTYHVELRVNAAASTNTTFTMELPQGVEMTQVPAFCTGAGSGLTPTSLGAPVVPVTATSWTALPRQTLVCNVGDRTANSTFTYPIVTKVRPEVPNGTVLTLETASATTTDVTTPAESNAVSATVSARAQYDISKNAMALTENTGYINSSSGIQSCPTATRPDRTCFIYSIGMLISTSAGAKGNTPMSSSTTFVDDLSPEAFFGSAITSHPAWVAAGTDALDRYSVTFLGCHATGLFQPGSHIGITGYPEVGPWDETNAVRNSGNTTCSQPGGVGTPVNVTITNADTTGYTYPSMTGNAAAPTPSDRAYVYSYALRFGIPTEAVVDLGTPNATNTAWTLPWRNDYTDFNPTGIDGVVNSPAANDPTNDYRASNAQVQVQGSFEKFFAGIPGATGNATPAEFNPGGGWNAWEGPAGSTGKQTGEGRIYSGATTTSSLLFQPSNGGAGAGVHTYLACDSWDNSLLQLTSRVQPGGALIPGTSETGGIGQMQRLGSPGTPVWLSGMTHGGGYYQPGNNNSYITDLDQLPPEYALEVEYGTGEGGSGDASRCDDTSSPSGWSTDPSAVPGNDPTLAAQGVYTAVTRVRVHITLPVYTTGTGMAASVAIGLRSVSGLPAGTILPNWATTKHSPSLRSKAEMLDPSRAWSPNTYNPANNTGSFGDRLRAAPAVARLAKQVKDPGTGVFGSSTPQFTGGQIAEFRLQPTLTAGIETDATVPMVVEDCLPVGTVFQSPSSSPPATTVAPAGSEPVGASLTCAPGETYVLWDFGPTPIGTALDPITYSVRVANAAQAGTKINTARITAGGDTSQEAARTVTASIQVVQPAGVVIDKVSLTPQIEVNRAGEVTEDPLLWRIDFANINSDPGPTDVDIIDVLPKQGLNGTDFTGTLAFDDATVIVGDEPGQAVEVLYTRAATLHVDASDSANHPTTGVAWCSRSGATFTHVLGSGSSADCPANAGEVTGLRIRRPGAFGSSDQISVEIQMTPSANQAGDVYVNETGGRATGLALLVGPVDAPATVVASSIGDRVWDDANLDGIQDDGEEPIAGFPVRLTGTDSDGNPVGPLNTTTDASGHYSFTGLQSGSYTVTFLPSGLGTGQSFTLQDQGANDLADSDGDPITGVATVTLAPNTANLSVDQGVFTADADIEVVKYINGDDANTAPGVLVEPGDDMAVTFDVTNTGNVALNPVVIHDDTIDSADIVCPQTMLAPGEAMTCTAAYPGPAAGTQHTNVATVTGVPVPLPDGTELSEVTDDDPANASGIVREVGITKDLVGQPVPNGDGTYTVTYDVVVTNGGTQAATYDLDDELHFGEGATVTGASVASGPAGVTLNPSWNGAGTTRIATGVSIPIDGAHTYRVQATASIDTGSATMGSSDCELGQGETGTGFLNGATLTFDGEETDVDACAAFPVVTFTKSLAGAPVANGDGTYTVDYDVVVTNDGAADGAYDLTDQLRFGGNIAISSASVANTAPGSITTNAGWNGIADQVIVTDEAIAAGASHTYRVSVIATVDGAITLEQSDCALTEGEDGTGFLNGATLTVNGIATDDDACAPAPNTSMVKALFGPPVVEADDSITATYVITVTNTGAGADVYDLDDELRFGTGITVNSATVSNVEPGDLAVNPAWDGAGDTEVVAGQTIASGARHRFVVTVNSTIGTTTTASQADCTLGADEEGTGFLNGATLTVNGGTSEDDACGEVDPVIEMEKSLVGEPVRNADGTWMITYDIDVRNRVAPNEYDLFDELFFGDGIVVEGATVINAFPGDLTTRAPWNGLDDTLVVEHRLIGAGVTHVYQVSVTATVPTTANSTTTDCTVGGDETGSGFLNTAQVVTETQDLDDDACAEAPNVSIVKDLVGDPVVNGDNTVDLTYAISVTNAGAGGDVYDLDDELLFGSGITVNSAAVVNDAPGDVVTNPAWDGIADTSVAVGVPIAGAGAEPVTHTYTVIVNATIGAGTTIAEADCTLTPDEEGTGFLNNAVLAIDDHIQEDDACGEVDPVIEMEKSLVGEPVRNADGTWMITYDIDVRNRVAPNEYDLFDELFFGDGIVVEGATVINAFPGDLTTRASWNGLDDTLVVEHRLIGAGVTHVYQVSVTATVPTTANSTTTDCTVGGDETGSGFLNTAQVVTETQDLDDDACAEAPNVSIVKDLVGDPVVNGDNTVDLTYAISVTNAGAGGDSYDLDDELQFGSGITVNSAAVVNDAPGDVVTNPAWDGIADISVAVGVPIAGAGAEPVTHTYTVIVNATIGAGTTIAEADCTLTPDEEGTGFLNNAVLAIDDHIQEDDACGDVDPVIAVEKTLVGAPTANGDGTWTIEYDITATNVGPTPGAYDLDDELTYGQDVSVVAASVANTDPGDIATNPDWDGIDDLGVADDVPLAVAGTHTYRVIVDAAVAPSLTSAASDCTVGADETGTGFLNTTTVTYQGGSAADDACAEIPKIGVVKKIVGTPKVSTTGAVDVTYALTVSNTGEGDGTYRLDDEIRWGAGLTVNDAEVTTSPTGQTADPSWNGTSETLIADEVDLEAGATHVWEVRVTGQRNATMTTASGDCTLGADETGTGLLNTATVTANGIKADSSDCGPVQKEAPKVPQRTARSGSLPVTGSQLVSIALVGAVLLAAGLLLRGAARGRRRTGAG